MSIISIEFLVFCTILLILYYIVFSRHQWILLLLASIIFYVISSRQYVIFVFLSIITTYICTNRIASIYDLGYEPKTAKKKAKRVLAVNLIVNIAVLGVLKYYNFGADNINKILEKINLQIELPRASWLLPLGLSFYTLAIISYTMDVYWKRIKSEKNIAKLALFTLYFPHILQGPISRYDKLTPQFALKKTFDLDRTKNAILLILYGVFKKMVLANRLSNIVSPYFENYGNYEGMIFIPAILLYSIEIYADFSGCMDILGGVSDLFGITLEKNFKRPIFARTIPEFWQRWHISLGSWFKDYVFFPVSISKIAKKFNKWTKKRYGTDYSKTFSNVLPLCCVWILTGIWHGAAWKYLLWGTFHCVLILSGTIFGKSIQNIVTRLRIDKENIFFLIFQIIRTYILCSIGRIFFRAESASAAFVIFKNIVSFSAEGLENYLTTEFGISILLVVILIMIELLQEKVGTVRGHIQQKNIFIRWGLYYGLIFVIMLFGVYGTGQDSSTFIYQQF